MIEMDDVAKGLLALIQEHHIWINLALYFESYEIPNFLRFLKNFSEFL